MVPAGLLNFNSNQLAIAQAENNFLFFKFLRLSPPPENEEKLHFSFHCILETHQYKPDTKPGEIAHEEDPLPWPFLLKVQAQCVNEFFERLRLATGPSLAEGMIPPSLKIDSLEPCQWFPICIRNPQI